VPTGKPPNKFALNEQYGDRAYAKRVIDETSIYWQKLVAGETKVDEKVISLVNGTLNNAHSIGQDKVHEIVDANEAHHKRAAHVDASVHQLAYVHEQ
jgi:hypothetical protein